MNNFESITNLKRILRKPLEKLKYIFPSELEKMINDKIVTIHLYPFAYTHRKEKCLLDLQRWSYHQIYLFIHQNQTLWAFGHGDTSQSRMNHNHLLEIFLKNKKAKVISAVIATYKGDIVSYYFHEGFAYCNHDIGSNWNREISTRLKNQPYSETRSDMLNNVRSLFFVNKGKEIEIYRQTTSDITDKHLMTMLTTGKFAKRI